MGCDLGRSVLFRFRKGETPTLKGSALVNASRGFGITPPNVRWQYGLPTVCTGKQVPRFGASGIQRSGNEAALGSNGCRTLCNFRR